MTGLIGILVAAAFCLLRFTLYPADRKKNDCMTAAVALTMPATLLASLAAHSASLARPWKYDLYIYQIDRWLGEPAFALGQLLARHPWLEVASEAAYQLIWIAFLAVFAACLWRRPAAELGDLVKTFLANTVLAVPVYLAIPVCGPAFAFARFPALPAGNVGAAPILLAAPPNGIPSVHFSTALLVCWFARHWAAGRIASLALLALTLTATLGTGQHYLVDLLLAIPYTYAMLRLGCRPWAPARQRQACGRPLQVEDPEFLELLRASGGRLVRGEPQSIVASLTLNQGE